MSSPRGLWQLTHAMTDLKRLIGGHTYWRHRTTGFWWSRDTAGHGGCTFKVYIEDASGQLLWYRDADEFGDFISPQRKHKGPRGKQVTLSFRSTQT